VQWAGSMFSIFFREGPVTNYDEARAQQAQAFSAFFQSMLSQGVHLPPSAFESWFVSASHDDAAIDRVLAALPVATRAVTDSLATASS
jgi:glutamate-1-semialdehyde 2,1-aminomutase